MPCLVSFFLPFSNLLLGTPSLLISCVKPCLLLRGFKYIPAIPYIVLNFKKRTVRLFMTLIKCLRSKVKNKSIFIFSFIEDKQQWLTQQLQSTMNETEENQVPRKSHCKYFIFFFLYIKRWTIISTVNKTILKWGRWQVLLCFNRLINKGKSLGSK